MSRGRRLAALEEAARRRENPKAAYLRALFAYLGAARAARQTGDPEQVAEADALRLEMHAAFRRACGGEP